MKINNSPCKSIKINGNQWQSMKPLETLRINEHQWKPVQIINNQWTCMKINEKHRKIMMGTRSRWQSMEANANRCLWKSMRQRRSMKVHGRIEQFIGKLSGGTRPRLARIKERRNNEKSVNQPSKQGKQARQAINASKQAVDKQRWTRTHIWFLLPRGGLTV